MLGESEASPDVALGDEIDLQRLYLALEARRFESRLRTEIDLPAALAQERVPRLILQPLVENAVKHGIGSSHAVVTIRIAATATRDRLQLSVEDDGQPRQDRKAGFGIGLANVRDRLRVRYGAAAVLEAGPRPHGGFAARIGLPRG